VCIRLESIEWIIVDHPFSPGNNLAPRPSTSSPSPGSKLSLFLFFTLFMDKTREYWMLYRGPSVLAGEWFGSSPIHLLLISRQKVVALSLFPLFMVKTREYWMIYRGPSFLAAVWFVFSPTSFPFLPAESCLSSSVFLPVELTDGKGGEGAKLYDGEKAWSSINVI
jgi:hypothetical protein